MFIATLKRSWSYPSFIQRPSHALRSLVTAAAAPSPSRYIPVDNATSQARHDDETIRQVFDSPDCWREFSQSSAQRSSNRNIGLFQNRYLTEPRGFEIFARASLQKARRIVETVLNATSVEQYKGIARNLDRLSDLLCRVIDLSDFVRATHPDTKIQAAATRAYSMMFEYMNILNTTTGLNRQLKVASSNQEVLASWSEEELVVAEILRRDFAKSAIDLPKIQRERFVRLSQEISEVGPDFLDNMAPENHALTFPSSKLKGMNPLLARQFTQWGMATLPTTGGSAVVALRSIEDEDTRKALFVASRTSSPKTLDRLEVLLRKRAELAELSRYESYSHLALQDKMAKSPESVGRFLQALSQDNKLLVQSEMAELLKMKMSSFKATSPVLQPWDKEYYMAQILDSSRSRSRNPDFLSAYFSVGTVMQGLSRLFQRLYGISLVPRETMPGETWNTDVRRIDVISETDGHVAVLYCDLFSRRGKSPNPAHFTLRCSREISEEEVEEASLACDHLFTSPEEAANDGMALSKSSGILKQLPTIALICDFQTDSSHKKGLSLLNFSEVSTLFHEMGHAIHSILGRTSLQNVSGTRCATDFAELPSVLMEHFASDPTVLSLFARHYETDAPLPYDMVREKLSMDKKFEGSDIENQIILSMVDQAYHSALAHTPTFNTTHIYQDFQRTHGMLPPDPSQTSWQGFFGHLFGYGSTYYSYLFDRVLAKRVWNIVFKAGKDSGSISRDNGERMKEQVLKWGGGRDPWTCLSKVLGDGTVESGGEKAMAGPLYFSTIKC